MTSRSSGCNRNGFFGFGASLGGLSVVAMLALAPMTTPAYADCFGDLTGPAEIPDGTVGTEDLQAVTSSWGNYESAEDLDGNGEVGILDLLLLLEAWGDCPNPCDQDPCQEGCTYNPCHLFGPCYDQYECCASDLVDPCDVHGPCYDQYECCASDWADPCDVHGPCYDQYECCYWADPCDEGGPCFDYWACCTGSGDPCQLWVCFNECCEFWPCFDPSCPGYDPCECAPCSSECCEPECPDYPDCW